MTCPPPAVGLQIQITGLARVTFEDVIMFSSRQDLYVILLL
jgi:hypothetical protein